MVTEVTKSGRPAAASKMLGHARKFFGWAAAQKIYGLKRSWCSRSLSETPPQQLESGTFWTGEKSQALPAK
jgi:hypothetical protein